MSTQIAQGDLRVAEQTEQTEQTELTDKKFSKIGKGQDEQAVLQENLPSEAKAVIFSTRRGQSACYTLTPGRLGEFVEAFLPGFESPENGPGSVTAPLGPSYQLFVSKSRSIIRLTT